jgi:hypothetical protein
MENISGTNISRKDAKKTQSRRNTFHAETRRMRIDAEIVFYVALCISCVYVLKNLNKEISKSVRRF